MREIVAMATKTSPDVKAAQARIARADADSDVASTRYLPTLEAQVSGSGDAVQDTFLLSRQHFTQTTSAAEGRADVRWTIWDFGRTSNAVGAADASRESAEHSADATRASVAQLAASLYITVNYDQNLVASKKIAVKHRTRFAAIAKALVERGVRPSIDETRARVALEAARHDLTIAEMKLSIDRSRLAMVCGIDVGQIERVAAPMLPPVEDDAAKASAAGEKARPDVAQAVADVDAADRRVDSARAGYLPHLDLNLTGTYRFTRRDFDDFTAPRREGIAILSITVPVFEPVIGATLDGAKADLVGAQAREEGTRRRVRQEAIEAALTLKAAKASLSRAKELENAASTNVSLMEARYASGLATPFELIDAETSDIDARETLLAAELRLQLATVDTLVTTGRARALEGS